MKSCFGYARVSTQKQGEGVSMDAQKDAILRFASTNDITITKWFEEKQTAAKSGRPVFNNMLKLLRARKASGVVMHKIDRSARNFRDWARIGELADAGIDVHFATESLDFRSRGGRLSADIQAVIAADYIRNLREEVIKGFNGRLKEGLYPLKAPVGYLDNGGGKPKTIDPVRGPYVREAFELYASGRHSIRSLLQQMNNKGLTNHQGRPISKGCLEGVLDNPFYTGLIRIRTTGACYPGVHEPLISVPLFQTVQDIKSGKAVKKVTRHNHTYRCLFQCAHCRRSMIAEKHKGYVYYRCQAMDCPPNSIREEELEKAVERLLRDIKLCDRDVDAITNQVEQCLKEEDPAKLRRSRQLQLDNIEKRLDKLTDALLDELIDQGTFKQRQETLLLDKTRLRQEIAQQSEKALSADMVRRFLERLKNLAEHYIFAPPDEKREIVEITTSNRKVIGKTVYLEPSKWLSDTQNMLGVLYCGGPRPTSRTRHHVSKPNIEGLLRIVDQQHSANLLDMSSQARVADGAANSSQ
jgi:site-specific DNA recombinase